MEAAESKTNKLKHKNSEFVEMCKKINKIS